jgi:hypothetical protein
MKVQFGAIITGARGKIGGHYLSRNHYGNFQGTIRTPANPQTSYQQDYRNNFLYLTTQWKNLTYEQQRSWIDNVNDFPKTDVFGNTYYSTAKNLFVSLNMNREIAGSTLLETCPTPETIVPCPELLSVYADNGASYYELELYDDFTNANQVLLLEATPALSPGIFNVDKQFRHLGILNATVPSAYDFSEEYTNRFPNADVGSKIFLRVSTIQKVSGQKGVPFVVSTIVVA